MVHIFIVNPNATNHKYSENIREQLEKIEDLNYFVFYTRGEGKEREIVRRILHFFVDEKIRIYCCGGSGTFCNVINGIDDLSKVEIAFFPCGTANLFLQCFGNEQKYFHKIENLVHGKAVPIDYIRGNHGCALNAFSVGVDATIINKIQDYNLYSVFGKAVPVSLAFLNVFFSHHAEAYDLRVDDKKLSGKYQEVYFGNGCSVGNGIFVADTADIRDGKGLAVLCRDNGGLKFASIISDLRKKEFASMAKKVDLSHASMLKIKRSDGKPFQVNLDGELQEPQTEWEIHIVNKGLNFVIPKGVTFCD